ncbi:oligosaccharyl transferase delta subunit [Fomitiporia mediterranea MF3/22]|uniref:oligosaccharyl transferase delta subunit n=1 Tax=Fomitiporia mediterranea (strain MF3/22) TaxID=694068 RepID=UPI00044083F5|nr:oligosaccharyl transferase delta subunit [Fomitiporia mediterranea MF3/22]EJC99366.1 oligosaccharyl transferase delta subunit [Fomitiporia mediterranea MF3/22]
MARSLILLPILAALASAAKLAVQNAAVSVLSSEGTQLRAESYVLDFGGKLPSTPLALGPTDRLKLTFSITEKGKDSKGVQPHQTFLRFYDETTGEEGIQPIRVNSGGKAKFELNMARPPPSLPPSGDTPLHVSLLIGSFVHDPLKAHFFDLSIPPSAPAPQHSEEATFHPLPEIHHTFRPEPKSPPRFISAVFAGVVLAPWLVLFTLLVQIPHKLPYLFKPQILTFVGLLGAFEGLLLWYWVALHLGQVLAYGAILGSVTILTGNRALNSLAKWRTEGNQK